MRSVHSRAARYRALGVGLGLLVLCSLLGPGLALAASDRLSELQKTLRASKNTAQRRQAAEELGKLGEEAAVPQLVQSLLADRSDAVRAACADSP